MLLKVVVGVATLLAGFVGGVHLQQVLATSGGTAMPDRAIDPRAHAGESVVEDCAPVALAPPYPVNANGLTYGSGAGIDEHDPGPDLVAAHGTDGTCGFIRASDRDQGPATLAEVLADGSAQGYDIPLYAQDGVTVIGTFRISAGKALTSPAPEPRRSSP